MTVNALQPSDNGFLYRFTYDEWELLCDNCGVCCFYKIEDEDSGELFMTTLYCPFLSLKKHQCKVYDERFKKMSTCAKIEPFTIRNQASWMPRHCAYRCVAEERPIPNWHPLLTDSALNINPVAQQLIVKLRKFDLISSDSNPDPSEKTVKKLLRQAKVARLDDHFEESLIENIFDDPLL